MLNGTVNKQMRKEEKENKNIARKKCFSEKQIDSAAGVLLDALVDLDNQ